MKEFWQELRRRKVAKVAVAYIVTAWLILQVTSILVPALLLPAWTLTFVTVLLILGFFVALVLSWAYELTPDGLEKDTGDPSSASRGSAFGGRTLDIFILCALLLVAGLLGVERFAAQPDPVVAEVPDQASAPLTIEERPRTSIAVLPFANFGSPEQGYFSDGISEELLNLLAKTEGLRVAARTSSFNFKSERPDVTTIGNALNVETILEGSVRWSGDRLRVTAQLIDVETGYHMWSETYDRNLTDVFSIQDEISTHIVRALNIKLLGNDASPATMQRTNIEAYKLYLEASRILNVREGSQFARAHKLLDRALEIDPNFVSALTTKSILLMMMMAAIPSTTAEGDSLRNDAQDLIDRAKAIDPENTDVLLAQGFLYVQVGENKIGVDHLSRAFERNPNLVMALHWQGNALAELGQMDRASEVRKLAFELDPLSPILLFNRVHRAIEEGDLELAESMSERLNMLDPWPERMYLGATNMIHIERGDLAEIKPNKSIPGPNTPYQNLWFGNSCAMLLLDCEEEMKDREEARTVYAFFVNLTHYERSGEVPFAWANYFRIMNLRRDVLGPNPEPALKSYRESYFIDGGWHDELFNNADRTEGAHATFVAWGYKRTGQIDEMNALLSEMINLNQPLESGFQAYRQIIDLANAAALQGDYQKSLELIRQRQTVGQYNWYHLRMPWYDEIADTPEFQAIWQENIRLTNVEREKLGFEPLTDVPRRSFAW